MASTYRYAYGSPNRSAGAWGPRSPAGVGGAPHAQALPQGAYGVPAPLSSSPSRPYEQQPQQQQQPQLQQWPHQQYYQQKGQEQQQHQQSQPPPLATYHAGLPAQPEEHSFPGSGGGAGSGGSIPFTNEAAVDEWYNNTDIGMETQAAFGGNDPARSGPPSPSPHKESGRKGSPFAGIFKRGRRSSNVNSRSPSPLEPITPTGLPSPSAGPDHQEREARGGFFGAAARRLSPASPGRRSGERERSRDASPTFVVRSVTRQPGGVTADQYNNTGAGSLPASPSWADNRQDPLHDAQRQQKFQQGQAGGSAVGAYVRQKSRPLSIHGDRGQGQLGVPPGGPGGGVGYGTARSPNDGRPIPMGSVGEEGGELGRGRPCAPVDPAASASGGVADAFDNAPLVRPSSPGAMSAKAFRRGSGTFRPPSPGRQDADVQAADLQRAALNNRNHLNAGEHAPLSSSPGEIASAFGQRQQSALSLSMQTQNNNVDQQQQQQQQRRQLTGPRDSPFAPSSPGTRPQQLQQHSGAPGGTGGMAGVGSGFRRSSAQSGGGGTGGSPGRHGRGPSGPAEPAFSTINAQALLQGTSPHRQQPQYQNQAYPNSPARQAPMPAGYYSQQQQDKQPPAGQQRGGLLSDAAIHGLPEPIVIPAASNDPGSPSFGRKRRGSAASYSGGSGFGSISPKGSGFLNKVLSRDGKEQGSAKRQQGGGQDEQEGDLRFDKLGRKEAERERGERGASPGFTGFFKGIFGSSPKMGSGEDYEQQQQQQRQNPMSIAGGPYFPPASPLGLSPVSVVAGGRRFFSPAPDADAEGNGDLLDPSQIVAQAELQKRRSIRQAQAIVDAERRRIIESPSASRVGFDPASDRPWAPKQALNDGTRAIDTLDAAGGVAGSPSRPSGIAIWGKIGRKAVPRMSEPGEPAVESLPHMPYAQNVSEVDALARLEGKLTPAQQIILETRSRHIAQEQMRAQHESMRAQQAQALAQTPAPMQPPAQEPAPVAAGERFGKVAGSEDRDEDVPVRRRTRSPTKSPKKRQQDVSQTTGAPPISQGYQTEETVKPPGGDIGHPAAGSAPVSTERQQQSLMSPARGATGGAALLPGRGAMPSEFPTLPQALQEMMVRFYRFERYSVPLIRDLETRLLDIERDAQMALHSDSMSATSAREREMDKWVGQMTSLMHHEVGQLKAATHEIREGRETLAVLAKLLVGGRDVSMIHAHKLPTTAKPALSKIDTSPNEKVHAIGSGEQENTVADFPPASTDLREVEQQHDTRQTNISSASFNSALPVPKTDVPDQLPSASFQPSNLKLPAGAAPALDKDELSSPSKRMTESHRRERSASPSGRPRYTAALGEPMENGRISPAGRHHVEPSDGSTRSMSFVPEPPSAGRFERPARQDTASPGFSDAGSNASSSTRMRRDQSVQDRIRMLVTSKLSEKPSSESIDRQPDDVLAEEVAGKEEQAPNHQLELASPIGDVNAAPLLSPAEESTSLTGQHLKTPSTLSKISAGSSVTYSPGRKPTSPLIGGRLSPAADLGERQRSASPTFVPPEGSSSITTSSRASSSVKARAQAFLQAQDKASNDASPSPSMWLGGTYGTSPKRRVTSVLTESEAAPQLHISSDDTTHATSHMLRNAVSHGETRPLNVDLKRSFTLGGSRKSAAGAIDAAPSALSPPGSSTTLRKSAIGPGASLKDRVAFFDSQKS
ncbi:hypothetical protein K437DRAFT_258108 [Tilletiaria anomala UBC 951]|uniref:Uncharacterized protein n=1 Tax=Tilletiaria anomala (strain ATCC 24038 / CBS 436.72 / UBC 951) TaxID=1037660 RepID=A0A066VSW6_TILAU|nr:uncharacterized protein K437DRAFT_258108 [Tilletiaria anomala UBC 951]KDN41884.1 hypothetical protein K437DRAFT_258108 [Tilletiaria anomala UBC 951]